MCFSGIEAFGSSMGFCSELPKKYSSSLFQIEGSPPDALEGVLYPIRFGPTNPFQPSKLDLLMSPFLYI